MNVTKTTVINEAEKVTANGRYEIRYTVAGNVLQSVTAVVCDTVEREYQNAGGDTVRREENVRVGELVMEYSMFRTASTGFPYSEKLPLYISDFIEIINEITAPATEVVEVTE